MTLAEKIQHVINQLSSKNDKGDHITVETTFKKAVKTISDNKIFGYELEHIEDVVINGRGYHSKVSYYHVIRNKH